MNFFKATQEAYTTSKMRLPDWPSGKFLVWGGMSIEKEHTDENGVITNTYEQYDGLILLDGSNSFPFVPTEYEEQSEGWERMD